MVVCVHREICYKVGQFLHLHASPWSGNVRSHCMRFHWIGKALIECSWIDNCLKVNLLRVSPKGSTSFLVVNPSNSSRFSPSSVHTWSDVLGSNLWGSQNFGSCENVMYVGVIWFVFHVLQLPAIIFIYSVKSRVAWANLQWNSWKNRIENWTSHCSALLTVIWSARLLISQLDAYCRSYRSCSLLSAE